MENNSRILKELREIQNDATSGVSVTLVNNSVRHLRGCINGALALPPAAPRRSARAP